MNTLASRGQLRASFLRWALVTVPLCLLGLIPGAIWNADTAWFASLAKPAIFPPGAVFGIVWTTLYVLMGIAFALVCAAWGARGRTAAIALFLVQLVVNFAWTPVFFGAFQITGGLVVIAVLAVLVIATTAMFWKIRTLAGLLMLPYLAWVLFAMVLNYQFLQLNPDADGGVSDTAADRVRIAQ
ncbi:TspO/MBR family protein [Qipengyuania spongiae]|uniref:Tryptophan-rich sensory protein n=1 Tax=Qipengyuania spongiae TaxID=2909673 RepID=A0ABY5SUC7_9SPHN|nr:TspO/MBR family protein [Qipengyuania spongiae]UVI38168.1 tryptophan-rich sensory protein [Qipengyuania spongiae]